MAFLYLRSTFKIFYTFCVILINVSFCILADDDASLYTHSLDVHYHPHSHHDSDSFKSRFRIHNDHSNEQEDLDGRLAERSTALENAWDRLTHWDLGKLAASSTTLVKHKKGNHFADSGIRFDHAWNISVGWVDNAKSDSEFLLDIGIGTPSQLFLASIDTGSPLLWVYSKDCCFAGNHSFFRPEQSSTFSYRKLDKNKNPSIALLDERPQEFTAQYGTGAGSISTDLAFETMTFFPGSSKVLEAEKQTIGLVTSIIGAQRGQGRDLRRNDALLGLSPGNGSAIPGKVTTPIEQLIRRNLIAKPLFTVTFVKAKKPYKQGNGGKLILGGMDEKRLLGDIVWTLSTSSIFWGFLFDDGAIRYKNKDVWRKGLKRRVIFDTGSSPIFLPKVVSDSINEQIADSYYDRNSSRWLLPCQTGQSDYETLLDVSVRTGIFTILLNGRNFGLPIEDLVLYPHSPVSWGIKNGKKSYYCNSAIQNGEDDFVVLGNAFIKNHAVTFDYGDSSLKNRRIGVANRRDTGIVVDIDGNIIAVGSRDKPLQFLPLNLY